MMRFGTILFSFNFDAGNDAAYIAECLREAQLAEELGLDAVWLAEHHFSGICPYADPVSLAAVIAATTQRVQIGFAVLQASFHHPVKLAEQISLLDNISRGRLIIGLGRGNNMALYEYDAYNVNEDETRERLSETEELLVALLSGACGYKGKYWNFAIPALRPTPYTKPHPTLLRSASSDPSFVRLAKERLPILTAYTSDADFARRLELYRVTMREIGCSDAEIKSKLGESWTWRRVFVAETHEEAERIGLPAFRAMREARRIESERLHAAVGRISPTPRSTEDALIYGTPDEVTASLAKMEAAGVGGVILSFRLGAMPAAIAEKNLRLFMKEVAPRFRTERAEAPVVI